MLPEASLFIPVHVEHELDGAIRARSEQGQSGDGQHSLVSKHLPSGMQLHTYECTIILSRETRTGQWVQLVQHLHSWEGFQLGLQDCPDRELVQFILHAIEHWGSIGYI